MLANESVLQFYTKFGYNGPHAEYEFSAVPPTGELISGEFQRVDMNDTEQRECLKASAANRAPVSDIVGIYRQSELFLWFCDNIFPNDVYYLPALDVYVLYHIRDNILTLIDIIGTRIPSLTELYPYMGQPAIKRVVFRFTPDKLCETCIERQIYPPELFLKGAFPRPQQHIYIPETARG